MYIDSNTLRMLMVYVLVQTQSSKLKIDFDLVQEFTPQVLKFTNRSYYITLLQSAFEYIDDMTDTRVLELMERADSQQSCLPLLNKDKIDDKREKYHKTNSNGCLIIDKLLAVEEEAKMKKIIKMK
uniref:VPS9 domain-containing protein n=1 Tax=Euplotes harpa TaxID=151035 RepID=A0A7S3N6W9_9SPIT